MNVHSPVHGGDLAAAIAQYGPGDWLDFSANINPDGPPPALHATLLRSITDTTAFAEYPTNRERLLARKLANLHGVAQECIVLANGSAALIEAYVRAFAPRRCLLPQPAFSEYERALAVQRTQVVPFQLDPLQNFALDVDALLHVCQQNAIDLVVITNPHNPSGYCVSRMEMIRIIAHCTRHDIGLLVDEAFIDYCAEQSISDAVPHADRIVVLRSLTKFFGIPGLRVGYGITSSAMCASRLTAALPSWPVTSLALDVAMILHDDARYAKQSITHNTHRRTALTAALTSIGCRVITSSANFLLFTCDYNASMVAEALARTHHIAVRDCSSYSFAGGAHFIRVAVRTFEENARLTNALASTFDNLRANSGNGPSE